MRYETVSVIDVPGELRRKKDAQNFMRYNHNENALLLLTITIAYLENRHCSRPHYHSISHPLQSHPGAIGRPSRETATIRSQQYRSAAECFRLVAVSQERTAPKYYYCIPYSRVARHESHQMGSDAPAECVLPRHSVSAVPPNLEAAGSGEIRVPFAPLSPAGPSCGPSWAHRKRRYRMSARTCSMRSHSSYFG
jgi:hypothetical protein